MRIIASAIVAALMLSLGAPAASAGLRFDKPCHSLYKTSRLCLQHI